ncbi:hypothetical protein CG51_11090 [Haematobacter missouriensis]|uniref:Uncharacterized protein n=1 Tax=Haematobacter missouriensis TaxID=366616 RepID=A0ABX3ZWS6_9RHOB|nr:hypothetical protein CG51_11090 [Haematobacter missouriensis]OWJ78683.1 hypothetical protein CDV53_02595 [Haematobacter missouriensis]
MPMCQKSDHLRGSARKYMDFRLDFVTLRMISAPTQARHRPDTGQKAFLSSLLDVPAWRSGPDDFSHAGPLYA